jgi:crotonobetaine/carnitine-CoA ligase
VLNPDSSLTPSEVAHWCAQHLAPQKVPRYVLFVDELPHTPTHKVAKTVLRQDPTLKARATDLHQ